MRYVILDPQLGMYAVSIDNNITWTYILDGASTFTLKEACVIADELNLYITIYKIDKQLMEVHIINSKNELFKVEANLP